MYYSYFGLKDAPFSIAVNPRYLYMSPSHRDALAHLLYGVGAGGGFIVLTGEVGTGKTTINRCLIEQLPDNADLAIVLNPALDARDLLATVCEELGIIEPGDPAGLKGLTDALHAYLLDNHARGRKTVLMIDEAQHLGFDVLEQIRLLTNLETNEEKLLHIILIGQPELAERLARPELRQLNQRITARFNLRPLSVDETGAYIRHRLHVAGMPAGRELFPPRLVGAIHRESRGIPRLINLLCDRMLLGAYGSHRERPDRSLLRRAAREVQGLPAPVAPSWWLPALAAAAGVLVIGVVAIFFSASPPVPPAGDAAMAGSQRDELPDASAPAESSPAPAPEPVPTGAIDEPSGRDVAAAATRAAGPLQVFTPDWFLAPAVGAAMLGRLYDLPEGATGRDPCQLARPDTVLCRRSQPQTWTRLLDDPRPALLGLVDARRVEGRALFLGIVAERALLAAPEGVVEVPLADVAASWTGEAWQYWQRPAAIERTLKRGDVGADVAVVAQLFARLDGQDAPLADERYDARLEARVRLFQAAAGLTADGVLGERTLRSLVLAAGDDIGLDAARARIEPQLANGDGA